MVNLASEFLRHNSSNLAYEYLKAFVESTLRIALDLTLLLLAALVPKSSSITVTIYWFSIV